MFGIANQLLGVIALAIGTSYILLHSAKRRYALTTFLPFVFLAVTIMTSGVLYIQKMLTDAAGDPVKAGLTIVMIALALVVIATCALKWVRILTGRESRITEIEPERDLMAQAQGTDIGD
jgi:carbon starvation protein